MILSDILYYASNRPLTHNPGTVACLMPPRGLSFMRWKRNGSGMTKRRAGKTNPPTKANAECSSSLPSVLLSLLLLVPPLLLRLLLLPLLLSFLLLSFLLLSFPFLLLLLLPAGLRPRLEVLAFPFLI